jgi:hypothetical protein
MQALETSVSSSDVDKTTIGIAFSLFRLCFISNLRPSTSVISFERMNPVVDSSIAISVIKRVQCLFSVRDYIRAVFRLSL